MKLFMTCLFGLFIGIPTLSINNYGWGFKKNDNHETPEIGNYAQEISGTSSYYIGRENQKEIYLTFDAGYDNGNLIKILDILSDKNVPAAFFVTGDFVKRQSELTLEMAQRGQMVCNHSWSHKNITTLSSKELSDELEKVANEYQKITGQEMAKFFRPPAGEFNHQSLLNVQENGYSTVFWSLAYKDWEVDKQRGENYAYQSVINNIHNGAIILMHTVSNDNVLALAKIIDELQSQGYEFKSLNNLLTIAN